MRRDDAKYANVLETLQAQHVEIDKLLVQLVTEGVAGAKTLANVKALLRQHMEAEEEVFYPAVSALGQDQEDLITDAETEHDAIEAALVALEAALTAPNITALVAAVEAHVEAERAEVFTAAREGFNSNQLHELAMEVGESNAESVAS